MDATALLGHRDAVVGLDYDSSRRLLLSSSEDNSLRLWDLRTNKAARLVKVSAGVEESVGLCKFMKGETSVVAACGSTLLSFDMRNSAQIVVSSPNLSVKLDEEINDFDVSPYHGLIAVPTDSGCFTILDDSLQPLVVSNIRKSHQDFCTVARWMPDGKSLLTGGQDYSIGIWGYDGRDTATFRKKSRVEEFFRDPEDSNPGLIVNPPFVTGMEIVSDGLSCNAAVALGNGSVFTLEGSSDSINTRQARFSKELHASSVACVAWMTDCGVQRARLWSAGTDRTLLLSRAWTDDADPEVRIQLQAKPNALKTIDSSSVAVSATDGNIYIYTVRY